MDYRMGLYDPWAPYALVDLKKVVLHDLTDVFILMLINTLTKSPWQYKRHNNITKLLALTLSKQEHTTELIHKMMVEALNEYHAVDMILM